MSGVEVDCNECQGTGIGKYGPPDESKCWVCGGRGYFIQEDEKDN